MTNTNDLGIDPNEWFESEDKKAPVPSWEDTAPCEYEPSDFAEVDWFTNKPKEEEKTIHQKLYEIATARYNPFSLGGSENCDSDISCNLGGGSETIQDR